MAILLEGRRESMNKQIRINIYVGLILALLLLGFVASFAPKVGAQSAAPEAKIWTNKSDYHPGTVVTIYGSGFTAGASVALQVTKLKDGSITNWNVVADSQGGFTTTYQIDKQGAPLYKVFATDGVNTAKITFTDSSCQITLTDTTTLGTYGNEGDTVTISGSGFQATDTVSITLDGSPLTVSGSETVQSGGSFSVTFTVSIPGLAEVGIL